MNRVIAFACADDPLARNDFFPAHAPFPEVELLELLVFEAPDVLLSLPHPDISSAPAASTLMAAADRLSFT
jgi:hypothetical protein